MNDELSATHSTPLLCGLRVGIAVAGLTVLGCASRNLAVDGGSGGTGAGAQAGSMDAAVEIATQPTPPTPPTPFSIPPAPAVGTLRPCGTLTTPRPLGFLEDGRPVVAQQADVGITLVRAWDPTTNGLEDLLVTSGDVRISENGRRLFELGPSASEFRAFDVQQRRFVTDDKLPIGVRGISGDGNFVLDQGFRRHSAAGADAFDFQPLLPANFAGAPFVRNVAGMPFIEAGALSFIGDGVAFALRTLASSAIVVAYQNGRSLTLPDGPDYDDSCFAPADVCGLAWSQDGRYLLAHTPHALRVWDLQSGQLRYRQDDTIRSAVFLPNSQGFVTVGWSDTHPIVERDLSGVPTHTWGTATGTGEFVTVVPDPKGNGMLFFGWRPGEDALGLSLVNRSGVAGWWRHTSLGQWFSFAITADSIFATFDDPGPDFRPPQSVGKWPLGGGPVTHAFRSGEIQSEFDGHLALAPDARRVAVAFPDSVRVLDAATLTLAATIPAGAGVIAWSPDGRYLATTPDVHYRDPGRSDFVPAAEISLWDSLSGRLEERFSVPVIPVRVAFDDKGKKLVGWGYPQISMMGESGQAVTFWPEGDPGSFELDLATGQASSGPLPPFLGATRELVATGTSIIRTSTGKVVSNLPAPEIRSAVFSGDWSVLLGLDERPVGESVPFRLLAVEDGRLVASGMTSADYGTKLAISHDASRVGVSGFGVLAYCLDKMRP